MSLDASSAIPSQACQPICVRLPCGGSIGPPLHQPPGRHPRFTNLQGRARAVAGGAPHHPTSRRPSLGRGRRRWRPASQQEQPQAHPQPAPDGNDELLRGTTTAGNLRRSFLVSFRLGVSFSVSSPSLASSSTIGSSAASASSSTLESIYEASGRKRVGGERCLRA